MAYEIRPERAGDEQIIHQLTETAFAPMPYGDGTEAPVIRALRETGLLTLSLVAEAAGQVQGHVAFSPATLDGRHDDWFGLGPIAVWPERQHTGIGSALITEGLRQLKAMGARGCVLIGNPAYYLRFGFRPNDKLRYRHYPPEIVQAIAFGDIQAEGELRFAKPFEDVEDG